MEIHVYNKHTGCYERRARAPIFPSSAFRDSQSNLELSARSNSEHNDLKSVTDCFKRGLALSATALAPENCLALFPRATHLIKHARFSCSPDPSHPSFFHSMSFLSLIHQHHRVRRSRVCMCMRVCVYARVHHTDVHTRTLYVPVLFSFPFLFLSLGHASTPFPHPRSSFEFCGKRVSLSSFLPPFLPVSPTVFFSLSLSPGNPDLSLSYPTRGCYRCCFFLYRMCYFPLRLTKYLLLAPSVPCSPAELPTASETAK